MRGEFYRQAISAIGLSLERGSPNVPSDGYFYVILAGEIKGRFRYLNQARQMYKALLKQEGHSPPPARQANAGRAPDAVEQYMEQLEDYWMNSHRHRRRGGKTMYRS